MGLCLVSIVPRLRQMSRRQWLTVQGLPRKEKMKNYGGFMY